MLRRIISPGFVFSALIAGVAAVASATPSGATMKAEAFRRPADVTKTGIPDDPVWRLGRSLYFDTRLSASGSTSCASCHIADHGLSGLSPRAIGDGGKTLAFKTPTLLNVGSLDRLGWTGKFADAKAVSLFAMTSAANMNMSAKVVAERLRKEPSYVEAFRGAFASDLVDSDRIGKALGRYVNSIVSGEAPFDRWAAGDETAIGPAAKRGFAVFAGKGHCAECHSTWTFTDGSYHDIGTTADDPGRGKLFKTSVKLQHAFKTPSLRSVAERAPYMHDGSKASLADVIDLYDRGGIERPSRAEAITPLHLSQQEKSDLVAFLKTLTSAPQFVDRR